MHDNLYITPQRYVRQRLSSGPDKSGNINITYDGGELCLLTPLMQPHCVANNCFTIGFLTLRRDYHATQLLRVVVDIEQRFTQETDSNGLPYESALTLEGHQPKLHVVFPENLSEVSLYDGRRESRLDEFTNIDSLLCDMRLGRFYLACKGVCEQYGNRVVWMVRGIHMYQFESLDASDENKENDESDVSEEELPFV